MHAVTIPSDPETKEWPCLISPEHVRSEEFKNWDFYFTDGPVESSFCPNDKILDLGATHHHGHDKLKKLGEKLRQNVYVERIERSTDNDSWNRGNFIPVGVGKVKVVLRDDAGYAMIVQTTARNWPETVKIAAILQKEYFG